MGGGALRCVCGRRHPGQLRLERCCGCHRGTILKFLELVRPYHGQQCHHARGKLIPACVCNIV